MRAKLFPLSVKRGCRKFAQTEIAEAKLPAQASSYAAAVAIHFLHSFLSAQMSHGMSQARKFLTTFLGSYLNLWTSCENQ